MFPKYLITLTILSSWGSRNGYCIYIQLIMAIVLHPHTTVLCPSHDWWLPLCVNFVRYMNCAFSNLIPGQWRRRRVQELEQWHTSEIWLQCMLLVFFVMNFRFRSMAQSA
jgi:hypothetical protein